MLIVTLCIIIAVALIFGLIIVNTRSLSSSNKQRTETAQAAVAERREYEANVSAAPTESEVTSEVIDGTSNITREITTVPTSKKPKQDSSDKMGDQGYRQALQQFRNPSPTEDEKDKKAEDAIIRDSEYRSALRHMGDKQDNQN
ncbi:hypothetical protein ACFOU2_23800 [Bacillus songklensis]|uniref:Uncharacterized protein n=1 Tax=Bacillus songklensis TaxID=1069116 RepID=A0ABV8B8U4_9BACI